MAKVVYLPTYPVIDEEFQRRVHCPDLTTQIAHEIGQSTFVEPQQEGQKGILIPGCDYWALSELEQIKAQLSYVDNTMSGWGRSRGLTMEQEFEMEEASIEKRASELLALCKQARGE